MRPSKARIFLLVDLRDFFSRFRVGGRKGNSFENDQLTGHFQSFLFLFLNISRTNSKTSQVKQQPVLNLFIFHFFSTFRKITVGGFVNQLIKKFRPKHLFIMGITLPLQFHSYSLTYEFIVKFACFL